MPSTKESTEKLKNQFNNFSSIELVSKAANLIEKIFWIAIAIGGTAWICGFVLYDQIFQWFAFPVEQSIETLDLRNMIFPAVTFCPKVTSQFSVIEGLGNYLDLSKTVPSEAILIRNEAIKVYWRNRRQDVGCNMTWITSRVNSLAHFFENCCHNKPWCKVRLINFLDNNSINIF